MVVAVASMAGLDQGQCTGLGLSAKSRGLAAFVGALVLVGTGEHGSQDHGKEVAPEDGASKLPVGALGALVVAGVVCSHEKIRGVNSKVNIFVRR